MKKRVFKKALPKKLKSSSKKLLFLKRKKKAFQKFPNIIRIFTEKYFLAIFIFIALLVAIIGAGLNLYKDVDQKQKVDKERLKIIKEIEFWKAVATRYKDYRDAYFQLATLEYRLGDFRVSRFYLEKTLEIDPNFEKGREFEKILNIK